MRAISVIGLLLSNWLMNANGMTASERCFTNADIASHYYRRLETAVAAALGANLAKRHILIDYVSAISCARWPNMQQYELIYI